MPSETTVETMSLGTGHTGPRIELRRPGNDSVFRADEPVTVHVEFLPAADGTAPNMATLNVRVRKGWFGKDITDVVQPYVEGAAVRVPEVDFFRPYRRIPIRDQCQGLPGPHERDGIPGDDSKPDEPPVPARNLPVAGTFAEPCYRPSTLERGYTRNPRNPRAVTHPRPPGRRPTHNAGKWLIPVNASTLPIR